MTHIIARPVSISNDFVEALWRRCGDGAALHWPRPPRVIPARPHPEPPVQKPPMNDIVPTPPPSTALLDAFLARRAALLSYFAARVGEADGQDIVQEIYLRVASARGDIEVQHPCGYLYRLGNNILLDRLRQDRARARRDRDWREVHHHAPLGGEEVSNTVPQDEALIARDQLHRMRIALADLPEAVQTSFRLHKFEGLTHAQVAERMGVSRSLIEKHIMSALRHLSQRLDR